MIIPDERALKNLSESPYVCISKLFLQPKKKQFYLEKCTFLNIFSYGPKQQNIFIYYLEYFTSMN